MTVHPTKALQVITSLLQALPMTAPSTAGRGRIRLQALPIQAARLTAAQARSRLRPSPLQAARSIRRVRRFRLITSLNRQARLTVRAALSIRITAKTAPIALRLAGRRPLTAPPASSIAPARLLPRLKILTPTEGPFFSRAIIMVHMAQSLLTARFSIMYRWVLWLIRL